MNKCAIVQDIFHLESCSRGRPFLAVLFSSPSPCFVCLSDFTLLSVLPFCFLRLPSAHGFGFVFISGYAHHMTTAGSLQDQPMCDNQTTKAVRIFVYLFASTNPPICFLSPMNSSTFPVVHLTFGGCFHPCWRGGGAGSGLEPWTS